MTRDEIYSTLRTTIAVAKANDRTHYLHLDGRVAPIVTTEPSPDERYYRVASTGEVVYHDPRLIADVAVRVP